MAIILNDNLQINAPKAIDARVQHYTISSRNAIDPNSRWAGMQVYVEDAGSGTSEWQYLNLTSEDDLSVNDSWKPLGSGESPSGDFIPLAGTESGSPVTGDIEIVMDDYDEVKGFKISGMDQSDVFGFYTDDSSGNNIFGKKVGNYIAGSDGKVSIYRNLLNGLFCSLSLSEDLIVLASNNPNFKGLAGHLYYGANYTDNTYVQKKYVDDNFLPLPAEGTTGQVLTTDGDGVYTWEDAAGGDIPTLNQVLSSGNTLTTQNDIIFADDTTSSIKNSYNSIDFENSGITLKPNYFTKITDTVYNTNYFTLDITNTPFESLLIQNLNEVTINSNIFQVNDVSSGTSNVISYSSGLTTIGDSDSEILLNGNGGVVTINAYNEFIIEDSSSNSIRMSDGDVEISSTTISVMSDITYDSGTGPVIYSPNQTAYRITVDNSGVLSATAI